MKIIEVTDEQIRLAKIELRALENAGLRVEGLVRELANAEYSEVPDRDSADEYVDSFIGRSTAHRELYEGAVESLSTNQAAIYREVMATWIKAYGSSSGLPVIELAIAVVESAVTPESNALALMRAAENIAEAVAEDNLYELERRVGRVPKPQPPGSN